MAKSGRASRVKSDAAPGEARQRLVDAAVVSLRDDGFVGASARSIARRAGCNQGLVFYHYGTVVNLLLAALDQTSEARMVRYRAAVDEAATPAELMAVAADIYREDLDAGHVTVLTEMIAGSSSTPGLGAEVATRIEPWIDFTETVIDRALTGTPLDGLVPVRDIAYAVVGLYLGVEMLSHLDGQRAPAEALLSTASRAVGFLGVFGPVAGLVERPEPPAPPAAEGGPAGRGYG